MLKGNIRGNSFNALNNKLSNWVNQGAMSFVELIEVTKTEEYTSVVRKPKKQTGVSTVFTESTDKKELAGKEYTITPDVDTRNNSPLWVVKFVNRMERDDFLATRKQIEGLGGYYSKFKRGFIFKFDPTKALENFGAAA